MSSSVAVIGAGAIGQLILQVVLNAGAAETVMVEPARLRRDAAVACGADQAVPPEEADRIDRRHDVVFDCTGAAEAFPTSLALVAPGGCVVVLGSYPSPITLDTVGREASVVFSSVYRNDREFAAALRMLSRGLIDTPPPHHRHTPAHPPRRGLRRPPRPRPGRQDLPGPGVCAMMIRWRPPPRGCTA